MSFEHPPPDLAKLLAAWEECETGEQQPGKVLANLKTAGLPAGAQAARSTSGWSPLLECVSRRPSDQDAGSSSSTRPRVW